MPQSASPHLWQISGIPRFWLQNQFRNLPPPIRQFFLLNEYKFISELRRVCKNQALVFISLPFIFPEHGQPDDFQRLTQYKLKSLFKKDEILLLQPSNNIAASVFIFINMFFRIMCGSSKLLAPIYIINNVLAIMVENIGNFFARGYMATALMSCPIGYSMIVRIKK